MSKFNTLYQVDTNRFGLGIEKKKEMEWDSDGFPILDTLGFEKQLDELLRGSNPELFKPGTSNPWICNNYSDKLFKYEMLSRYSGSITALKAWWGCETPLKELFFRMLCSGYVYDNDITNDRHARVVFDMPLKSGRGHNTYHFSTPSYGIPDRRGKRVLIGKCKKEDWSNRVRPDNGYIKLTAGLNGFGMNDTFKYPKPLEYNKRPQEDHDITFYVGGDMMAFSKLSIWKALFGDTHPGSGQNPGVMPPESYDVKLGLEIFDSAGEFVDYMIYNVYSGYPVTCIAYASDDRESPFTVSNMNVNYDGNRDYEGGFSYPQHSGYNKPIYTRNLNSNLFNLAKSRVSELYNNRLALAMKSPLAMNLLVPPFTTGQPAKEIDVVKQIIFRDRPHTYYGEYFNCEGIYYIKMNRGISSSGYAHYNIYMSIVGL